MTRYIAMAQALTSIWLWGLYGVSVVVDGMTQDGWTFHLVLQLLQLRNMC